MTKRLLRGVAVLMLIGGTFAAGAAPRAKTGEEQTVLATLKKLYPATTFTKVSKTPLKGVYEVVMGQNIAYVDASGRHFLFGHLFDMQTQSDLTAQHEAGGSASPTLKVERAAEGPPKIVKLSELPLQDALKRVNGNGARTLVVFSDPLCPYCKRLEAELPQLENTTIYTFLTPILGSNSRKAAQTRWAETMPERANDIDVLDRNMQLASRYGINGTPTLIRADGQMTAGAMPAAELTEWLNSAADTTAQLSAPDLVKETP
ncbi:MAG: DsbC family protein [Rhizobacter sp.]